MKIAVVGIGYVGLSNAILLAQHHEVIALDVRPERVESIRQRQSPLEDAQIRHWLQHEPLQLRATLDAAEAFGEAACIVIATPTNYDETTGHFDTRSVEAVIAQAIDLNANATLVIKSTVPVGFTEKMRQLHQTERILFSPEFLREGRALHDNLYPSRIVVAPRCERAAEFAQWLQAGAHRADVPVLLTGSMEAEAIKLFANTYLAMRVAFFNELDTYAQSFAMDARAIIDGVCLDPRIGQYYNNPSFGYGGYCLPKDTRQLLANYDRVPNNLIRAIVDANQTRKDFIAETILARKAPTVGIYRLIMKTDSENFRSSAIQGVIRRLRERGQALILYEPRLAQDTFMGVPVITDLDRFKARSDLIIANRLSDEIASEAAKIYSRDLFGGN